MKPIHVFALVVWVWCREMPLGRILLGRGGWTTMLATECIDAEGEEAWVLV